MARVYETRNEPITAANDGDESDVVALAREHEPDRGEHRRLAEAVERRVEERAEDGPLARRPGERAVEDVGDRADDEEDAAEPEEELRVALLEADEDGARRGRA